MVWGVAQGVARGGSSASSQEGARTSQATLEIQSLEQAASRVLHELRRKATFEERRVPAQFPSSQLSALHWGSLR